jgi:hypothetical protein
MVCVSPHKRNCRHIFNGPKLITQCGIKKNHLSSAVPTYRNSSKLIIIEAYHTYQLHTKFYFLLSRSSPHVDKIIGDNQCEF